MELDFEDLISQSIITNDDDSDNAKSVSVKTTQSKEYDLVYNKNDSSFHIKVKKDGKPSILLNLTTNQTNLNPFKPIIYTTWKKKHTKFVFQTQQTNN